MKRALTTLTAALLLMACENKPPEGNTSGVNTDTNPDPEETQGDSSTGGETDPPATTTEAPGTTTETGTSGEDTCSFLCTTGDTGGIAPECDNWAQDCPDDEKCAAYADDGGSSWNNLKCVPVQENGGGIGDQCTVEGNGVSGIDSCAFGGMCWAVDPDTGQGACVALCTGTPEAGSCGDSNTTCVIANEGVLNLCLPKCDPLLQDCGNGDLCLPNPDDPEGFVCVIDASGETGVAFDPCEYANACDKGFVCDDPGFATECDPQALGCCLPYCDTSEPECPGEGLDCIPWYAAGTAPPGYETLGLCGIPQG